MVQGDKKWTIIEKAAGNRQNDNKAVIYLKYFQVTAGN